VPRSEPTESDPEAATRAGGGPGGTAAAATPGDLHDVAQVGFQAGRAVLRMEGWKVNHKRVQRLWREEGLRVPPHSPKRRRLGNSTVPARRL
jgi:hypothetical protein